MKISLALLLVFVVFVFGKWHWSPLAGDLTSIEVSAVNIDGDKTNHIVSSQNDIAEIQDVCGDMWLSFYPIGSNEGLPFWMITLNYQDGSVDHFYIDEDEFAGDAHNNDKLIALLKHKYN